MRKIQHSNESNSHYGSESEDSNTAGFDAWSDAGFKSKSVNKIMAANKKVRLYSILKNYNIQILKSYATQTWSNLIQCPFPSHKDRTPSFGYNFRSDHFHCLGCKRSGKAVEFIAAKEEKLSLYIAESILEHYADSEVQDVVTDEREDPRVQELLFKMSEIFRESLISCKDDSIKIKNIEKIIWWFDMFIAIKAGARNNCKSQNLDVEELEARVFKAQVLLQKLLNEY